MLYRHHHPEYLSMSRSGMTVSTISKALRAKLPVISPANKLNAKMTVKRVNKNGEVVAVVKTLEMEFKYSPLKIN